MKELIAAWGKQLEALVAADRGHGKFKHAVGANEYVHVFGPDSSMLEIVIDWGAGIYCFNRYTRIIWSERNPPEAPFAYKSYEYNPDFEVWPNADTRKSKQAFFDDKDFKPEYLTAAQVEERLGFKAEVPDT